MFATRLALAGAAALLAAAPAAAQLQLPPAATQQAQPFLATAGMSDVYEITSSQIALKRSQNPQVRAMATELIGDHTRTTNEALAAAKMAGVVPPPPVLDAQFRALIGELLNAPAANFDRLYLAQQVPAHEAALRLHQGYAASGDTPALRDAARTIAPVVQGHLDMAQRLQSGMSAM